MIALSPRQREILQAKSKRALWLFDLVTPSGGRYHWSTRAVSHGTPLGLHWRASAWREDVLWRPRTELSLVYSVDWRGSAFRPGTHWRGVPPHDYSFRVVGFDGVRLRRTATERGLAAPSDMEFTVRNHDGSLSPSELRGADLLVSLVVDDGKGAEVVRRFRFRVRRLAPGYKSLRISCEAFYSQYLRGDWPNTPSPFDLFPDTAQPDDDACLPVVFGTAYVPVRSCWIGDARYYLLGEAGPSYSVFEVRSPHEWGVAVTWEAGTHAMAQADKASGPATVRVLSPVIADSDGNGSPDAVGVWLSGGVFLDMPCRFSRSDTASLTCPAAILARVLRDFGIREEDLDLGSFTAAGAAFAARSLSWSGGFTAREDRQKLLSRLLAGCAAHLNMEEQVELVLWDPEVKAAVTGADILRSGGQGSFRYECTDEPASDSGYVAWQVDGASQAVLARYLVPAKASKAAPSRETLELSLVKDSVAAQKLGCLHYQKSFLKQGEVAFTARPRLLGLQPGDVVEVGGEAYGGTARAVVDEVVVNKDLSVSVRASTHGADLDGWDDLGFAAVSVDPDATPHGATFYLEPSGANYA